ALDEVAYGHIEIGDRLELVRLRRKPRHVPAQPRTWILKAPVVVLQVIELVEVSCGLAETRAQERLRHLFGDRVHTDVFAAGTCKQPHVRDTWGGNAHAPEDQ